MPSLAPRPHSIAARGAALAVIALGLLATSCSRKAQASSAPAPIPVSGAPLLAPAAASPVPATFDVAALVERVKPAVVNITTSRDVRVGPIPGGGDEFDPFEFFFGRRAPGPQRDERVRKQSSLGSGFLIDAEGHVVTNEHVVRNADDVRVRLADDREFAASLVGRDPKLDLAVLKVVGARDLPRAELGSSVSLRVGEHVVAIGNPFGLGHTVTLGIVSAKDRQIGAGPYDDFIQTDASINPGNSGGPLFNWRGEVVGINTAIRAGANGIGFAIPVDALKDVLPQLLAHGHVARGKLGLTFQPVTHDLARALGLDRPRGALVVEVEPGGAAARAGIRSGDLLVEVNGQPIERSEELPRAVARNRPGSKIRVALLRGGARQELEVALDALRDDAHEEKPERTPPQGRGEDTGRLGLRVTDAQEGGVLVESVSPNGPSRESLQRGDRIVEVNGKPIRGAEDLRAAAARARPGQALLLKVKRGGATRFAAVTVR